MRLAISNIAWPAEEEAAARSAIAAAGITGLEVAPTRAWPRPADVSDAEASSYRQALRDDGFEVVAMQALLYGREDLTIFESETKREETLAYLASIFRVAGALGARSLVFGSPRNRRVGGLSVREIDAIAVPFFRAAGEAARACDTVLCLEANPPQYGCDYLTTSAQCIDLLHKVDSEGLGLHLDTAAMTLAGESVHDAITAGAPWLRHFHISEPYLAPIGSGGVDHLDFSRALEAIRYREWLSVEMRAPSGEAAVPAVERALQDAGRLYASVLTRGLSAQ